MLDCAKSRTKLGEMDFKVRAYKYWKVLPPMIRCIDNLEVFRNEVKLFYGLVHVR